MLTPIPLLIVPFAIYNILSFITPGLDWRGTLGTFTLPSGSTWTLELGAAFIAFSLLVLFFELIKATKISSRSIIDHMLSLLLLIAGVVEFLMVPQAASSVFALLVCIMLLDVMTGFSVSIRVAQRDVAITPPQA
ncbi:hypothetical protein GCM10007301_25470 [Azorhizobium oxalatiphilum]|uniref:Transmembrane protein n=1 Tax=Azorhizobium oxalatiphilum TaxID=980631 RepID=A0A917FCD6_9HYPH|nr:hypothetical protein [Azorhizobium oxalatiphilum]GGF64594.1 hypothetical protein GCM10007301_25470 [Azorhizobium oxalatiphilum]